MPNTTVTQSAATNTATTLVEKVGAYLVGQDPDQPQATFQEVFFWGRVWRLATQFEISDAMQWLIDNGYAVVRNGGEGPDTLLCLTTAGHLLYGPLTQVPTKSKKRVASTNPACTHRPRKLDVSAGYDACMYCIETGDCDGHGGYCRHHGSVWAFDEDRRADAYNSNW